MKDHLRPFFLRICVAIVFLFAFVAESRAQFDSLGLNTKWRSGSIVLDDNSVLKGLIQFNDKLGMIKFKKTPDAAEESFVETSVSAMQFYDEDMARWRNFAVFNIDEEQSGRQYALLFEVLMEFSHFALLARVERVNIGIRTRYDPIFGGTYTARVGHEQFEHLCLANEAGKATVVLSVSEFERDKLSLASKLSPFLDRRALEEYLGDDWDQFRALVKSQKLNLRKRDDFVRAFEYLREAKEGSCKRTETFTDSLNPHTK